MTTQRVYNFNPGPATLPTEVLQQAQEELLNWHGQGMSIMEMSHRSKPFMELADSIEENLRELLSIPVDYKVLFMQGGARGQFAAIPLNLLHAPQQADYVETGIWSKVAFKEAQRFGQVNLIASSEAEGYTTIPLPSKWQVHADAAYLHYVDNETVNGVEFPEIPVSKAPLIADMSSNILSRPINVKRFAMIYAGSQKNIGPAGVTMVILHSSFLREAQSQTPSILNYSLQAEHRSLYNTPPTFVWYMMGLVLQWIKKQGGLAAMAMINQRKAEKLYACIDQSGFYSNSVDPQYRSRMNVVFRLPDERMNERFLNEAERAGLAGLKGHSLVGGMRASLFNAMPEQGVDHLIAFMKEFAKHHA